MIITAKGELINLENAENVFIVSGEGTGEGKRVKFVGKRTPRAINVRLKKESCKGDRWAFALIDGIRVDSFS